VITARQQFSEAASKQADQLNLLTRRMDSSDDRYAQLSGKFQVTTEKLGLTQQELNRARSLAANIQKQQQAAVQQLNQAIAQKASAEEVNKLQSDAGTKFGALSGDIAGTKKDLEATKEALMGTKGELSGAIARTHDELVTLAHRTDRDYFEFNLARRGLRQKVGSVVIELVKTNPKKNQFTVNLYFDDKRTERKDKAVNEPIYFYAQGASSALELVVNKLDRNVIGGYLSTPKGFFPNTPNVLAARPG
jgi:chromosome segregation ATPase